LPFAKYAVIKMYHLMQHISGDRSEYRLYIYRYVCR